MTAPGRQGAAAETLVAALRGATPASGARPLRRRRGPARLRRRRRARLGAAGPVGASTSAAAQPRSSSATAGASAQWVARRSRLAPADALALHGDPPSKTRARGGTRDGRRALAMPCRRREPAALAVSGSARGAREALSGPRSTPTSRGGDRRPRATPLGTSRPSAGIDGRRAETLLARRPPAPSPSGCSTAR